MSNGVINFAEKLAELTDVRAPKIVAATPDYHFELVKLEGASGWHSHDDADEVLLVISGELEVDFGSHAAFVRAGEMIVVRQGIAHRTLARRECGVLVLGKPLSWCPASRSRPAVFSENEAALQ